MQGLKKIGGVYQIEKLTDERLGNLPELPLNKEGKLS